MFQMWCVCAFVTGAMGVVCPFAHASSDGDRINLCCAQLIEVFTNISECMQKNALLIQKVLSPHWQ